VNTTRKLPHPSHRHRDVRRYSADDLHDMLVDDGVNYRPLGGNGQNGSQWMMDALLRIAGARRQDTEAAFQAVLDDIEARTGRKWLAIG
jgi:hypothetical protein